MGACVGVVCMPVDACIYARVYVCLCVNVLLFECVCKCVRVCLLVCGLSFSMHLVLFSGSECMYLSR